MGPSADPVGQRAQKNGQQDRSEEEQRHLVGQPEQQHGTANAGNDEHRDPDTPHELSPA